jgi:hypothetical protein
MLLLSASKTRQVVGVEDTDRVPGPGSDHPVEARQAAFINSRTTWAGLVAAFRGILTVSSIRETITTVVNTFSRMRRIAVSNSRTIRPGSRVTLNS